MEQHLLVDNAMGRVQQHVSFAANIIGMVTEEYQGCGILLWIAISDKIRKERVTFFTEPSVFVAPGKASPAQWELSKMQ